jgi:hypothetical protein
VENEQKAGRKLEGRRGRGVSGERRERGEQRREVGPAPASADLESDRTKHDIKASRV